MAIETVRSILARVDFLRDTPTHTLDQLATRARWCTFRAGDRVMEQGGAVHDIHVIVDGYVSLQRTHPALRESIVLAWLGPGEVIGGPSTESDPSSPDTAIALMDTVTLALPSEVLTMLPGGTSE